MVGQMVCHSIFSNQFVWHKMHRIQDLNTKPSELYDVWNFYVKTEFFLESKRKFWEWFFDGDATKSLENRKYDGNIFGNVYFLFRIV